MGTTDEILSDDAFMEKFGADILGKYKLADDLEDDGETDEKWMDDDDESMAMYSDGDITDDFEINEQRNQLATHLSATDVTVNQA